MAQVDIIMPLYNKADTVTRAIQSIRQQTFTEWKLIVVDDGSVDNTAEIVGGFRDIITALSKKIMAFFSS